MKANEEIHSPQFQTFDERFIQSLEQLRQRQMTLALWQNQRNDKQVVQRWLVSSYDSSFGEIQLVAATEEENSFILGEPVYLCSGFKGLVGKFRITFLDKSRINILCLGLRDVRSKENRSEVRLKNFNSALEILLRVRGREFCLELLDISRNGLGFKAPASGQQFFPLYDSLTLIRLGDSYFHRFFEAEIRNVNSLNHLNIRVGIQFKCRLPEKKFITFVKNLF